MPGMRNGRHPLLFRDFFGADPVNLSSRVLCAVLLLSMSGPLWGQ